MTEQKIQKLLINEYNVKRNHLLLAPNVYLYNWESDLLSITRNYKAWEFEIKCSRFDYKNDLKKIDKHNDIRIAKNYDKIPNKFWYVGPDDIIDADSVPEYAGLIHVKKYGMNYYLKEVKNAPTLHNEPFTKWEEIAIKLFYKLK